MTNKVSFPLLLAVVALLSSLATQVVLSTSAQSATVTSDKDDRLVPSICASETWPDFSAECFDNGELHQVRIIYDG